MYKPKNKLVWTVAFFLTLIGVVIVTRRTFFLIPVLQNRYEPTPPPPGMPNFPEEGFVNNPVLTLLHILPALLFILFGLLQFVKTIRTKNPRFHRWNGRVLLSLGAIIGVSGIVMGFKMPISGVSETAATTLFGTLFLFSLTKAFISIRQKKIELHREWMIRAFAIGMAVTTTRPIVGIFFATSRFTGLTPQDFFGTALWIGFTLHLILAEVWINRTRRLKFTLHSS
ncbi:MAG: DUF2306 domain-containing protein [Bacteroidetes bacterium]|nr:DUF2306 domain-containing protein [Bacteroidota bacterium]MBI3481765.1 DUF2306 domain-containing protein [Bacteroidota bacterium]